MDYESTQASRQSILGRITSSQEISTVLAGYRAQAWEDDQLLAESITDSFGRFLLEWLDKVERANPVSVRLASPWGDPAGVSLTPLELLSPAELSFSAVIEPRFPSYPESASRGAPSSEVVSEADLSRFQQAVAVALDEGYLRDGEFGWVEQAVADLDRAHTLAFAGVQGDLVALEMFRTLLQLEYRWKIPIGQIGDIDVSRPPISNLGNCFVEPRDPLPLIWGGVMLDGLRGDWTWSERGAGFFNSRAMPINAVFNAAAAWAEGSITPSDFSGIVKSYDLGRFGQDWSRNLPERPQFDLCLSERDVCLGAFLFDLNQYGVQRVSDPPQIGSIVPDTVCEGFTGGLTLYPPAGTLFPAKQPADWGLAVDGQGITIQNWDPGGSEFTIAFPANVKPGCQEIVWVHVLDPEFVNHVRDIGGQCAPFFGGSEALMRFPLSILDSEHGISVTVIGTPKITRFTAQGQNFLVAEGCVDVKLEWEAALPFCPDSSAQTEVSLLADGNIIAVALALKDHFVVNEEPTMTYTIRVEGFIGGARCSYAEKNVQVQRFKAIHLFAPGEVGCIDAGDRLPITVRISCPAPAGGTTVSLVSSNPARLPNARITIPEGRTDDFTDILIGGECGEVTLTASAHGYQSDSFKRMVSDIPQITAFSPAEVNACQPFQLSLEGSCFGENLGQQVVALIAGNNSQIAGKITQLQANKKLLVDFPALEPGQFQVAVGFCGKAGIAQTLLNVKEKSPTIMKFSAAPGQLDICPTAIKLTWRVDSARRVRILRDGVLIQGSERTRNQDCGVWEESFDDPELQTTRVRYTLEAFPGSGSPVSTSQTTISASSHTTFIGLAQNGSGSFNYNNNSVPDPLALCAVKHALVTTVTNNSGFDLSLAHGVAGAPFIVIQTGSSTNAFNGQPVEGNWTAQLGGRASDLPAGVTIKVDWTYP